MNLNKFILIWRKYMARKTSRVGDKPKLDWLRVQLNPVTGVSDSDPMRLKEIHDLIARIVLLGNKRGRTSKKEMEGVQDAA